MKYLLLIISSTLLLNCFSQQDPLFSSEGFTPLRTNPASFGSWNKFSVNTAGRLQWVGIEGAPKMLLLNGEYAASIGKKESEKTFDFSVGMDIIIEEIGYQNVQQLKVPLVYPLRIGKTTLAFGVAPGFQRLAFDPYWTPPQTGNDPSLPESISQSVFDIDAGMFWYGEQFYGGFSITHITQPLYDEIGFSVRSHFYAHGAYRFDINGYGIMPMLRLKADQAGFVAESMNYFMFKHDIVSLGVGYRFSSAVLAAAAVQWKGFRIAYNFDYDLSPLSNYNKNTHEIRLSYIIKKDT